MKTFLKIKYNRKQAKKKRFSNIFDKIGKTKRFGNIFDKYKIK